MSAKFLDSTTMLGFATTVLDAGKPKSILSIQYHIGLVKIEQRIPVRMLGIYSPAG